MVNFEAPYFKRTQDKRHRKFTVPSVVTFVAVGDDTKMHWYGPWPAVFYTAKRIARFPMGVNGAPAVSICRKVGPRVEPGSPDCN